MISAAESITHQHLLSVLNTEVEGVSITKPVRLLDVGCGDGLLIKYLTANFGVCNQGLKFEIYGLDVADHGVQADGYFEKTIENLEAEFPDTPWKDRLHVISTKDVWPFSDCFFDIILSNQVVEHVSDQDLFFSEIGRTLVTGGFSVHLFHLKNSFYESHLKLPLVHRFSNHDFMEKYIKTLSKIGWGKYKHHNSTSPTSVTEFAERHADYIFFFTNYLSYSEVLTLCKKHYLPASFRYTQEYYFSKIRSIIKGSPKYKLTKNRSGIVDWFAIFVLKYVSSVTLVLHKGERYTQQPTDEQKQEEL
jgi:SAM-dependent methyltransferase